MKATVNHSFGQFEIDFSKPIDISIPLREGANNVNAFYSEPLKIEAVRTNTFIGDVNEGGAVNYKNIFFNPHGNGTHTECFGHISSEKYTINQCLKEFFFLSKLISIHPQSLENNDRIINVEQLKESLKGSIPEVLIIRTLPNSADKLFAQYSGTNPPYLQREAAEFIQSVGIKHLLVDLPSVEREEDGGALFAHKAFWRYPSNNIRKDCTITEMIYVPESVVDGFYLLNLQISSFENDASPSKPVLYKLINHKL